MPATIDFAFIAIACHTLLGLATFLTNPRRPINRSFMLLTLVIAGWNTGIHTGFLSRQPETFALSVRWCSFCGALIPTAMALMRTSIVHSEEGWLRQFVRIRWWVLAGGFFAVFCFTPFYLKEIVQSIPAVNGASVAGLRPIFHPAIALFYGYLAVSVPLITYLLARNQWRPEAVGVHQVELQFIWLAWATIPLSICLSLLLQSMLHDVMALPTRIISGVRVIGFDVIIIYGITSRGILQIRAVVRIFLSHLLLAVYAAAIYAALWVVLRWMFRHADNESTLWPSVLAGGSVAILVNSLSSPFRRITRRILPSNDLDFERIFGQVRHLLQSVATLDELLAEFCDALGRSVGALRVRVLLPDVDGFRVHRPMAGGSPMGDVMFDGPCLREDDAVIQALRAGASDLAVEELARHASTPEQRILLERLKAMDADLIVPARYRNELSAILILSPRVGGHIFGGDGRSTLRLVADQLAVAIINAHLYTEAYRSQAYNRLLVEHLPCGVITTDPEGTVRVVNPEARRLLQVDENAAPDEVELPHSFSELVIPTLSNHAESPPEEIVLRAGSRDQANLRVNCLPMEGQRGELLGAVLVLNDHTTLEKLQRAVRQADRLASIGTLASGMAHEIKNPLTALKTFTQLLPKRYNDAEFRHDFSGLAGSEIARIERIVNQLLAFARPAPLMIEQVNLHEIIGNAVKLVGPQASRHQITIRTALNATADYIAADKDRLQQVLLNLLLNAIQANTDGGWIEASTEMEPGTAEHEAFIRLDVRDNGSGIPAEILPNIFDPFFTTKGEGTGLGLSVSYNIVAEHKGRMEVQSESGKGTCFSLYLPVC